MTPPATAEPPRDPSTPRAAILLIGNELLSGKIRDENGWFLSGVLRRRGIELVEIAVVPDDLARIGEALRRLLDRAGLVFTSGGVGPTHDDVTLAAIAAALERPLERNEEMAETLRAHYGDRITPAALSMADLPRGTELRAMPGWPVLRLDVPEAANDPDAPTPRVYILPGIPDLLKAKINALEALDGELPSSSAWQLSVLETDLDESRLAAPLDAIVARFPEVDVGSYPRWEPDASGRLRVRVRVTFEANGRHGPRAEQAKAALVEAVGAEHVL